MRISKNWISLVVVLLTSGCATSNKHASTDRGPTSNEPPANAYIPCDQDPERLKLRSNELTRITQADQDDRTDFNKKSVDEMMAMARRDVDRRKRVGEIFGEGCLTTAADFANGGLVFQHGDRPEHYLQAFTWAQRAIKLGDKKQKWLAAVSIDRYLASLGQKQLFGSQASVTNANDPKSCFCLDPIEPQFPDSIRKEYLNKTLSELHDWLKTQNEGKACSAQECAIARKPSPRGTVPGFW